MVSVISLTLRLLLILCAGILFSLTISSDARAQMPAPTGNGDAALIWPNAQSKANSDDWIRLHHAQIRQMQPRLLVLNFVNGLSTEEATRKIEAILAAIRESSRYHGYARPNAPAFLDYKIYKVVDLTDGRVLSDDVRFEGNSSKYPRTPDWKEGMPNFQYGQLFDPKFADYYNIPDANDSTHLLTLNELVNRGIVNEVWFLANQGKFGAPLEEVEVKQLYDDNMRKIPGRAVQAGLNASDQQPFIGRSLRILSVNPERGPGVALLGLRAHIAEQLVNGDLRIDIPRLDARRTDRSEAAARGHVLTFPRAVEGSAPNLAQGGRARCGAACRGADSVPAASA